MELTTSIVASVQNLENDAVVTFATNIIAQKLKNKKVKQAIFKLKQDETVINIAKTQQSIHKVYYVNKNNDLEVIDCIKSAGNNGFVCIDITDELIDALKLEQDTFSVKIENYSNSIASTNNIVLIRYEDIRKHNSDSPYQEFSAGKIGSGKVNLFDKNYIFCHKHGFGKGIMPINVEHIYNSNLAGKDGDDISFKENFEYFNSYNMGKGWKLNYQQYIIKNKPNDRLLEDGETAGLFTYITGDGSIEEFKQKYYYKADDKNIFIEPNKVHIGQDGNLTFVDENGNNFEVFSEIITDSGLGFQPELEGFSGLKLVQTEIDEIDSKRRELISIRQTINECEQNICQYNYSIEQIGELEDTNSQNFNATLKSLNLQKESLLTEKQALYNESNLQISQYENNLKFKNYNITACDNEEGELKTKHADYVNHTYELQQKNLDNLYDSDGMLNKKISVNKTNLELIEKNIAQTIKDLKFQKQSLLNNVKSLTARKNEYEIMEQRKAFELGLLESQVPACVISNSDGTILGFGKTADENVYRLVMIADNYENAIMVKYDDLGRIIRLENTEEQSVEFVYNKSGLLSELVDTNNKKTVFEYNEFKNLIKITDASNNSSSFDYNDDGLLTVLVYNKKYGTALNYNNKELVKISKISSIKSVKHNDITEIDDGQLEYFSKKFEILDSLIIEYYDYLSTTIKNEKTDKQITYVFDENGKPTTVYENKFENGTVIGNVKVKSFEKDGNQKAFTIEPKPSAIDLMVGAQIKSATKATVSESYLSSNTICGTSVHATEIVVPASTDTTIELSEKFAEPNMLECNLSSKNIDQINLNNSTDYVLMCWAKADSAWAKRRLTDYCKGGTCKDTFSQSELDKLIIESADELKLNRRFELRAEIVYQDRQTANVTRTTTNLCSYDHNSTRWQYLAVPVTIEPLKNEQVKSIKAIFDYSYNTGKAQIFGMKLKEGTWNYQEFNSSGNVVYSENSESNTITTYSYDNNSLLTHKFELINGKTYQTCYYYNKNKSLIKTVDYDGVVSESVYNNKGQVVKSFSYHKSSPATKLYYNETVLSDKGQQTCTLNELGEEVSSNSYDNSGNLLQIKSKDGETVAYGYNDSGTLLQSTATVDGEVNYNTFGYTDEYLTKLSHNGFDYNYEYDNNGRQTKISIANTNYVTIDQQDNTFNKSLDDGTIKTIVSGESITKTYANGDIVKTNLDNNGNVLDIKFNNKPVIENIYDLNGNLVRTVETSLSQNDNSNPVITEYNRFYDNSGRQTELNYNQFGKSVSLKNTYNNSGNVKTSSFQLDNETLSCIYNYTTELNPKLSSIVLSNGDKQNISYDSLGRVNGISTESGLKKSYSYVQKGDHTSNLVAYEDFSVGNNHQNTKYFYDKNGNITKIYTNGKLISAYTYDSLNRLIREDNKPLNSTVLYGYDAGGNISYKIRHNFSLSFKNSLVSEFDTKYTYSASGWKDQLVRYNDEVFEYDQLGNPVIYRNKNLYWNRLRNLINYNNEVSFEYNFNGIRTSKISNGVTTKYYINGSKILAQSNGNVLYFHYGAEGVLGFTFKGVGNFNYIKNIFGDVVGILDSANNIIVKYVYDAWGNHKTLILSESGKYVKLSKEETYTDKEQDYKIIAEINPFRYRGYYYDIETGLYYLNSRYYDPEVGRFINADSLEYLDQNNLNGLNLYNYCLNNPTNFVDYNGNFALGLLLVLGLLIGGSIAGGSILGKISYDKGKRGWELVKDIVIGGAIGLATAGIVVILSSMVAGLAVGVFTPILGITALKSFAIGSIALNFVADIISPIFGLDIQGIEYETPDNYNSQENPTYQTPIYNSFNLKNKNSIFSNIILLLSRRNKVDNILWRTFKR